MPKINYEIEKYENISRKKIYGILKIEAKNRLNELIAQGKKIAGFTKQYLYNRLGNDEFKFLCMELAGGDIDKYEKYYKEYSISYIMELYTINVVVNYRETPR